MAVMADFDFWIEINYRDGRTIHSPWVGSRESAEERCYRLVAHDESKLIDFVVLLTGDYSPGAFALDRQILGDWQGYPVSGAKKRKIK